MTLEEKVKRAQDMFARINSLGSDEQSSQRFGYARACAITGYNLLQEVRDELAR